MKLTILGSGTSVPNGERNSSGYFVELPGALIMLDCGAGTLHALARYRLPWERITHLFVSHFHVDHIGELASLFFALKYGMKYKRTEPFTLVGPRGIDQVVEGLKMAFGAKLFQASFPIGVHIVNGGDTMDVAPGSTLSFAKTPHTDESLAVRVESGDRVICYTGDTEYSEELAGFFDRSDLLISECSFREPREGARHLSVGQAARLAALAEVKKLIVTHFYFDVDESDLHSELKGEYSGEVIIGRDGLVIDVP